jgi:murein tripeptide amidase MpaA
VILLARSRNGRDVELLQIGEARPTTKSVLVTGRHHAAETVASYVLEGFLLAAMSDDSYVEAFRSTYVLYAVAFVDKDGVEERDQGDERLAK